MNWHEQENRELQKKRNGVFLPESEDTHTYRGWLNSDSFYKRAFAVFGYSMVAQIIVSGIILLILYLFIFTSTVSMQ